MLRNLLRVFGAFLSNRLSLLVCMYFCICFRMYIHAHMSTHMRCVYLHKNIYVFIERKNAIHTRTYYMYIKKHVHTHLHYMPMYVHIHLHTYVCCRNMNTYTTQNQAAQVFQMKKRKVHRTTCQLVIKTATLLTKSAPFQI